MSVHYEAKSKTGTFVAAAALSCSPGSITLDKTGTSIEQENKVNLEVTETALKAEH